MYIVVILTIILASLAKNSYGAADLCNSNICTIDKNCRCSSSVSPAQDFRNAPQLIVLAFVESVTYELYKNYWSDLLESRTNPDGEFIGATFYVPHEYTDYQIVHDFATMGFEIGVHSVSNDPDQDYWRYANETLLEQEFGDQRKIIAKFANIPIENIVGAMAPQLQLAGDNSIRAFVNQGFSYDSSWPTQVRLFPYTFDYLSSQTCNTGNVCPTGAHPGFWETPINDMFSPEGNPCATIAACFRKKENLTADEISNWILEDVKTEKDGVRAPLIFVIESNWFKAVENAWEGLNKALDNLQGQEDVFFVTQKRVLEWIKNPVPYKDFKTNPVTVDTGCSAVSCKYKKSATETRYMNSCVPCPANYPWMGNPYGN